MKPLYSLFFLVSCFVVQIHGFSQEPGIEWQVSIGGLGGGGHNILSDLHQTADGGYIAGGSSDANSSVYKSAVSKGGYDFWVVKLSETGTIEWERTYGGSGEDRLSSIRQTADGGYIIGGHSNSGVSGDKTEGSRPFSSGANTFDYWILKTDASGNIQWQRTIGSSSEDRLANIAQLPGGDYIVSGNSDGGVTFEKTIPSFNASEDYWILKLDRNGNTIWQQNYGGSSWDIAGPWVSGNFRGGIEPASDGGFMLSGTTFSGLSGNKTAAIKGDIDYWILKLNAAGDMQWQKDLGGKTNSRSYLATTKQTPDGGYVAGGYSESNAGGDKTSNVKASYDFWIIKLNSTGSIQWQKDIGGSDAVLDGADKLYALNLTGDGGYILAGESRSGAGDKTDPVRGGYDFWMVKLDMNGNIEWDKTLGSAGDDTPMAVQETTDGGYILGGLGAQPGTFDQTGGLSTGAYWIIKLHDCSRYRTIRKTICEGESHILPKGRVVNVTGTYRDTLKTFDGCDSIVTTYLEVFPKIYEIQARNLCIGQQFSLSDGRVITASGTYVDSMLSVPGCDSVLEYHLSFLANITFTQNASICAGGSFVLPGGRTVSLAGTYRDTLTASFGCDSIVVTNLSVDPYPQSAQSAMICPGSSYILPGGASVKSAGTYRDTISMSNGCDSIVVTDISLLPYPQSERYDTVCAGNGFILPGGAVVTVAGSYSDTLKTGSGCDSVVTTNLFVKPNDFRVSLPATDTIIRGQSLQLLPWYENGIAVSWIWTPDMELSCVGCEAPDASPRQTIVYTVTVSNDQRCSDTAGIRILVKEPGIYVPSAFSPNGDGLNDQFRVYAVGVQTLALTIFNRWGEVVFQTSDPNLGWDGIYKGEFVPVDDYQYIINAVMSDGSSINKSGSVSVLR